MKALGSISRPEKKKRKLNIVRDIHLKRQLANGQKVDEKFSTSFVIRAIQIKATMRYHFTIGIIKMTKGKCWWGCKQNICALLMGTQISTVITAQQLCPLLNRSVWSALKHNSLVRNLGSQILKAFPHPHFPPSLPG